MAILLLVGAMPAAAQEYVPVDRGSRVEFTFQQGKGESLIKVKGSFTKLLGLIQFDPQHLNKAAFDISMGAATLHTTDKGDEFKLKSTGYFDVAKYSTIRIKSTSITQDRPGGIVYILNGSLTMKGITRPVKIQFTTIPSGNGYMFRGLLQFSKQAFGLGEKGDYDDIVAVYLQVNSTKK